MRVFVLIRKDLARVVGDRRALLVNLLMPLVLTTIMGLSFGGGVFGGGGLSTIELAAVGEDLPAGLRDRLTEGLNDNGFFHVTWVERGEAERRVRTGEATAALVLPPSALRKYVTGEAVELTLWKDPGRPLKSGIVEQILTRSLRQVQAGEAAYRSLWPDDETALPPAAGDLTWEELFAGDLNTVWKRWRDLQTETGFSEAGAWMLDRMDRQVALTDVLADPPVGLVVDDAAAVPAGEQEEDLNLFAYFLPGFAVFFLMFGVAADARDLHRERAAGTLQRQLLAPVSGLQLLAGKWLSAMLQGVGQLLGLLVAGAVLFQVSLGPDPWSLLVLVVMSAAAAASFFMLVALIAPTEKIMDNLSTSLVLVAAMVGGNMMPVDNLPPWIVGVGRLFFNYWSNVGFQNVVAKDISLAAAPEPVVRLGLMILILTALTLGVHALQRRRGGLL